MKPTFVPEQYDSVVLLLGSKRSVTKEYNMQQVYDTSPSSQRFVGDGQKKLERM